MTLLVLQLSDCQRGVTVLVCVYGIVYIRAYTHFTLPTLYNCQHSGRTRKRRVGFELLSSTLNKCRRCPKSSLFVHSETYCVYVDFSVIFFRKSEPAAYLNFSEREKRLSKIIFASSYTKSTRIIRTNNSRMPYV